LYLHLFALQLRRDENKVKGAGLKSRPPLQVAFVAFAPDYAL
jgi:hypothetical protein